MWLSEGQIKVKSEHDCIQQTVISQVSQSLPLKGFFSRYMRKRAAGGTGSLATIQEVEHEPDKEIEEDEERAIEEALEEAEFMQNVELATEVI